MLILVTGKNPTFVTIISITALSSSKMCRNALCIFEKPFCWQWCFFSSIPSCNKTEIEVVSEFVQLLGWINSFFMVACVCLRKVERGCKRLFFWQGGKANSKGWVGGLLVRRRLDSLWKVVVKGSQFSWLQNICYLLAEKLHLHCEKNCNWQEKYRQLQKSMHVSNGSKYNKKYFKLQFCIMC